MNLTLAPIPSRMHRTVRRGFNLVEMLIALAITAALLSATMVALDASFMAYQATTEEASTHTIGRLTMHRMLALIRTGQEFGPFPINPQDSIVFSDFIEFQTPVGQIIRLEWAEVVGPGHPIAEALYLVVNNGTPRLLLEGVPRQPDPNVPGEHIRPFTLEYELGRNLYRATIDLTVVPGDNMSVDLDGDNQRELRFVASAIPRILAYEQ